MPKYRSHTSTHGRNMAGARALWRATGMKDGDFDKPIIAIANSFTQFVPGHVHLKDLGQLVAREIEAAGGVAKEFNTIAIDDGIAMGHDGMLYSLPSREIIADSVEYMCNAHTADALVCISNCDKITPGMLNAALRLNIPTIFVSGGPMEAGKAVIHEQTVALDLIDAMITAANPQESDETVALMERSACPTCGSCSGMFTANSMNCLTEALGLSLPGNGTLLATHKDRERLFKEAGRMIVALAKRWYEDDDASVLPRSVASFQAFENAMSLDIAMGGSTNTVLHLLPDNELIVDDDVRNIFALTALLERQQMEVFSVDSGREALELLEATYDPERDYGVVLAAEGWHPGVIGIVASREYTSGETTLAPGDRLIIYTDGLIESMNGAEEEYGEPRMLEALKAIPAESAQKTLDTLVASVDAFAGGARQHDDLTCLILHVN